jgi:hypothetical protein
MSVFEPWVGKRIGEFSAPKLPNLNRQQFAKEHEEEEEPATVRTTPTPANTGAPMPGYRQRTNITPESTGAPMPGTLKQKTSGTIPVKHTRAYPKKKTGTAPGTRPRKK